MKNDKPKAPPKFEEILSQEEHARNEAALKIKNLKEQQKQSDPNDFMSAMSMGASITDQQDAKKKFAKAAGRAKRAGNMPQAQEQRPQKAQASGTKNQKTKTPVSKDPFASLYD